MQRTGLQDSREFWLPTNYQSTFEPYQVSDVLQDKSHHWMCNAFLRLATLRSKEIKEIVIYELILYVLEKNSLEITEKIDSNSN